MSIPPFVRLPVGVEKHTLLVQAREYAALDNSAVVGQAPVAIPGTALLVPGFTGSKEDFIAILKPLGEAGIRAIAFDLPGQHESSGNSSDHDYSLQSYAADVQSISAHVDPPVRLLGHSFGGIVVRDAVLSGATNAHSVVLMDSGPGAIPADQHARMHMFAMVLRQQGPVAVWAAKQALEEAEGVSPPTDPHIAEFLLQRFHSNAPESMLAMVDVLCTEPDRSADLAATGLPILVVCGENDDVWTAAEQERMSKTLGAHFVALPGVGHSPAAQSPSETVAALLDFWATERVTHAPSQ